MKASETVNREGLLKIMQNFGCPELFTQTVRQFHGDMMARVTDNGTVPGAFVVFNGVKQGCALTPTLLALMFTAMLMDAFRDECPGFRAAYRTNGHLLNHWRVHFQSRVSTASSLRRRLGPQRHLRKGHEKEHGPLRRCLQQFRLFINTEKTVVVHQLSSDAAYNASQLRPTASRG
ncbi:hypothetical protein SprV_0200771300 [Sparganum proliferum]